MSGRGKPRKDARRAKRLKQAANERANPAISGAEEMVPENVTLTSLDDIGGASKGNKQFPPLVEEVFDIAKIVGTESDGDHIFSMTVGEPEQPPLLRCADDNLAALVPQQLKQTISANKFINIALLLKGNTELADTFSGGLLQIADDGKIEAKPRTRKEKVANIDKYSDAFLIFASIYLQQFPDKVQQLLKYMAGSVQKRLSLLSHFEKRNDENTNENEKSDTILYHEHHFNGQISIVFSSSNLYNGFIKAIDKELHAKKINEVRCNYTTHIRGKGCTLIIDSEHCSISASGQGMKLWREIVFTRMAIHLYKQYTKDIDSQISMSSPQNFNMASTLSTSMTTKAVPSPNITPVTVKPNETGI